MLKTSFQLRTIGNLLKERRKERQLTLSQISEITKIRMEYLKAIEEGNYNIFPSEVYLKGFLKNYAKFLGVNTERALAMYRREREFQSQEPTISMTKKIRERGLDISITPGKAIAFAVIIAVVLIVVYISTYIGRVLKEPNLRLISPVIVEADSEETMQTDDTSILLEGNVEVGSTLTINGQEFQTNNFERFREKFELQEGENKFTLVAESQFGRKTQLVLNVVRESEGSALVAGEGTETTPTATPTIASLRISGSIEVVNREAYIEYTLDDKRLGGKVYEVGAVIEITPSTLVKVFTPRPDALAITINGNSDTMSGTNTTWEVIAGQLKKS